MEFTELHRINLKNKNFRKANKTPTLKGILEGVPLGQLKPNPLKCLCGHYPKIEDNEGIFDVICSNQDCDNHLFNVGNNYQGAIFEWNESKETQFDHRINKIHPLVWYTAGYDSTDYIIKQTEKIEANLKKVESGPLAKKEIRLIRLIRSWNRYASIIANRIEHKKTNYAGESHIDLTDEEKQIISNSEFNDTSIPNQHYLPDPEIKGPMIDHKDNIQVLGSGYYWNIHGHMVRTKVCKHTGWRIPTYIVYVKNKGTNPGYQVRIDLRSIGIPYYSKMHGKKDLNLCLMSALEDLQEQLRGIKHTRKIGAIIERGKIKGNDKISIDDIKGVRLIRSLWDSNHRAEVTLASPNDHTKARFAWSIGGKTTFSYHTYRNAVTKAINLYLAHTKLSNKKEYAHGGKVRLKELDNITISNVIEVTSKHFGISLSDTAHYLTRLNPYVFIGYLSLSGLREDNTLSLGNKPMQVVSNKNKRGYISGQIKKHDILYNADCVCIDTILKSNLDEHIRQPSDIRFIEGKPEMGMLLSRRAVEMLIASHNTLRVEYKNISLESPESIARFMQQELIELAEDYSFFDNKEIEYKNEDGQLVMYLDGKKTAASVSLEDWDYSYEGASLQTLATAYALANKNGLFATKSEYGKKDLSRRYAALNISQNDVDLSQVRFISTRASKIGIRNVSINKSGKVLLNKKSGKEQSEFRKLYDAPNDLSEFESIIERIYPSFVPLNSEEKKLIELTYRRRYTSTDRH